MVDGLGHPDVPLWNPRHRPAFGDLHWNRYAFAGDAQREYGLTRFNARHWECHAIRYSAI